MKTICFNILNSAATHLPKLHQLSDAGAGKDLMHLTPTRDTELIVYGQPLTPLPSTTQNNNGLLSNRGVSPAVLSRGLLQMFYNAGYQIEFNSFNFNVAIPKIISKVMPKIIQKVTPKIFSQTQQNWLSVNQHVGGLAIDCQAMIKDQLLPTLIAQAERDCISIVAECGVGGTTFSTLWLRLLTGQQLTPLGSTQDRQKLSHKAAILAQLEADYLTSGTDFRLTELLENPTFHDEIQQAVCTLVRCWPRHLALPHFAGGMIFVAPLLAARKEKWFDQPITLITTPWALKGDGQHILKWLSKNDNLQTSTTDFNQSQLHCLNVYEQGHVVEGCGLGGTLVLAERLGWRENEIIAALELAVREYLSHF